MERPKLYFLLIQRFEMLSNKYTDRTVDLKCNLTIYVLNLHFQSFKFYQKRDPLGQVCLKEVLDERQLTPGLLRDVLQLKKLTAPRHLESNQLFNNMNKSKERERESISPRFS